MGFRSAHRTRHGREPACTFPGIGRGLLASTKDNDPPGVFDYIMLAGDVDVAADAAAPSSLPAVRLFADTPCGGDATLYPSDHFGIVADLTVGARADKAAANRELVAALTTPLL